MNESGGRGRPPNERLIAEIAFPLLCDLLTEFPEPPFHFFPCPFWREIPPCLAVSLFPVPNENIHDLLARIAPKTQVSNEPCSLIVPSVRVMDNRLNLFPPRQWNFQKPVYYAFRLFLGEIFVHLGAFRPRFRSFFALPPPNTVQSPPIPVLIASQHSHL